MSKTKKRFEMTLANKITVLRIIFIPAIVICLIERKMVQFYVLLTFSILSDLLDGLAARLRGERTQLGAFLDPLADKLLLTSVFLTLTYLQVIDMWVFVVIFSRDLLIVLGWTMIYILTGSSTITPRILGKITTTVQMISALAFTFPTISPTIRGVLLWSIGCLTIVSAIDYVMVGEKRLGQWA
jgi:cardiolipin synthase (CMP-forming)